ncbi:MAG: hypothetical protein ACD_51C00093G0005 [uncultured bacterium]|nr:MAG: hypothetical protein ACD_51C00093G0005 [uncultured bacterium]OGJ48533.1 MAG: hypothetical protein A2244_02470 [Candidatus Peregrinibacteria bacterium RIFOXYA2_FULL_41_18]OGJ48864.1 MAG: hypothetical protein A2344_02870 [Candidatus Peregrinibacteria bacterium RIFOXYB12_FULL_41_12]OGJ53429.1 MAG: hypothetical protein A2448_01950 [Candidatus Peregrinibacteria bacterium RIFOXYC2_FULL_41_22]
METQLHDDRSVSELPSLDNLLAYVLQRLSDIDPELISDFDKIDPISRNHSIRVAYYAMRLIERRILQISDPVYERGFCVASMFHDIGKNGSLNGRLFGSSGLLDYQQRAVVQTHVRLGVQALQHYNEWIAAKISAGHHEHQDNPYPRDGGPHISGSQNRRSDPLAEALGECLAAIDQFDAVTDPARVYFSTVTPEAAQEELASSAYFPNEMTQAIIRDLLNIYQEIQSVIAT